MFKRIIYVLPLFFLLSCTTNGPQKTLDETAKAMENNNPQAFLANIDLQLFASNYLATMTENDQMLNILNSLGNTFGLGGIQDIISSIVDVQADMKKNFTMGISTGELMAKCKVSETPDCPWVPASLREAQIIEIDKSAAIAKVTTPMKITSWLALRKIGEKWVIVGMAPLENQARSYALKAPAPTQQTSPQPGEPGKKAPAQQKPGKEPVHI